MFAGIYPGLKVFVTGHTGFKGSWLCAWLTLLGADVTGFSLDVPTDPANFTALELGGRMTDLRGDVRNLESVLEAMRSVRPDIVFHLAAQALVRKSYADPLGTFQTNSLGTLNVLEAVRQLAIPACVVVTSDKCYHNNEWVWGYRETDRLGGDDPYSASKGCAELIAHSYFASYLNNASACATARAGNVIGGGDWAQDRIVPDCARAWQAHRAVDIRNPGATRPWQHVLEPLSGYLWLGSRLMGEGSAMRRGQSYNFGPPADSVYSVSDLAAALARFWPGFTCSWPEAQCQDRRECTLLKLCCDKALADLGWKATLNFEETVRYTAEWYARYYASQRGLWDFASGQIRAYVNAATERGLAWVR